MTIATEKTLQSPPITKNGKENQRRKFWLRAIKISLTAVIAPPLFGLLGTIISMTRAFAKLSDTGKAAPEALTGDISFALLTTRWGFVISTVALIILIGVLIRFFTLPKPQP